jgi:hypothetical protein
MSMQVGHAMNTVLEEANERIKFPLRKLFINFISPSVSNTRIPLAHKNCVCWWHSVHPQLAGQTEVLVSVTARQRQRWHKMR